MTLALPSTPFQAIDPFDLQRSPARALKSLRGDHQLMFELSDMLERLVEVRAPRSDRLRTVVGLLEGVVGNLHLEKLTYFVVPTLVEVGCFSDRRTLLELRRVEPVLRHLLALLRLQVAHARGWREPERLSALHTARQLSDALSDFMEYLELELFPEIDGRAECAALEDMANKLESVDEERGVGAIRGQVRALARQWKRVFPKSTRTPNDLLAPRRVRGVVNSPSREAHRALEPVTL